APWRKGLEALAVALHRQQSGRSPTVNFGRLPVGFRIHGRCPAGSSAGSAHRRVGGLRRRGAAEAGEEVSRTHRIALAARSRPEAAHVSACAMTRQETGRADLGTGNEASLRLRHLDLYRLQDLLTLVILNEGDRLEVLQGQRPFVVEVRPVRTRL